MDHPAVHREGGGPSGAGRPDRPLVSVLVACFDHEPYLERALDSVAAQSYDRLEVVIVDDCSTDGSAARIRRWLDRTGYPATFVANATNTGICAVLNALLARATGEYCVLLDTDDWFEPDRIERHVERFATEGPDVAVVYGDATMVDASGTPTGASFLEEHLGTRGAPADPAVFDALLVGNFLPTCAVTVRRSTIDSVGGYDEALAYDDYDMWLRLAHRYRFVRCDGRVANYRVLATSMCHSAAWQPRLAASTIRILARWARTDEVCSSRSRRLAVAAQLRVVAGLVQADHPVMAREAMATADRLTSPWARLVHPGRRLVRTAVS